jgi:hypothetical protein
VGETVFGTLVIMIDDEQDDSEALFTLHNVVWLSSALVRSGGERLCDIRKRGRAAFDKRIGRVSAHSLGLTSSALRPKRL